MKKLKLARKEIHSYWDLIIARSDGACEDLHKFLTEIDQVFEKDGFITLKGNKVQGIRFKLYKNTILSLVSDYEISIKWENLKI